MSTIHTRPDRTIGETRRPTVAVNGRRSAPHVVVGALLVLACATAFAVTGLRVDPRTPVLVVAHEVPVGHALAPADLSVVRIVPDPTLGLVTQAQRSTVLGRTLRLPVAAHTLLSTSMLGEPAWPPAGQGLVAVSVKAGRAPAGLTTGTHVIALVVPTPSATTRSTVDGPVQVSATVASVGARDTAGGTAVSLLVAAPDAVRLAGAPGDVALIIDGDG